VESSGTLETVDLRDDPTNVFLFDALTHGLYVDCFPNLDEAEEPDKWKPRLWGTEGGDATMRAIIMVEGPHTDEPRIAGFICTELYLDSHCGLISYLGVDPRRRSQGLGKSLIELGISKLRSDAKEKGIQLKAVFAEIHVPRYADAASDAMDPNGRVTFFARVGAVRVPVKYVQPPVRPGQRAVAERLQLICLPLDGTDACALEKSTVAEFLTEYYLAQGQRDDDKNLVKMINELDGEQVALEPLQQREEEPFLAFTEYAIAFHFIVWNESRRDSEKATEPFTSFERDVFAYAYRDSPPFWTRACHVPQQFRRVKLTFAPELHYDDEGDALTLVRKDAPAEYVLDVHASETQFKSGVDVKHLVLSSPHAEDGVSPMNEYDVIKLIKLWEGGENVHGSFHGAGPESCSRIRNEYDHAYTILDVAGKIFGIERADDGNDPISRGPKAGIVQLVGGTLNPEVWVAAKDHVAAYAANNPDRWTSIVDTVESLAGIVQGIIDFHEIGADELNDVFAGVTVSDNGLFGLHKGTLISIEHMERPEDKDRPPYPVSPYTLFPQAVLLNNEALLERAAAEWREVQNSHHLPKLQDAVLRMRKSLDSDYVPNVFHYPQERALYTRGDESRALQERATQLRQRLDEVNTKYEFTVNARRSMADDLRNVLLLMLAYTSLRDLFPNAVPGYALFLGIFSLGLGYLVLRWQGVLLEGRRSRKDKANPDRFEQPTNTG
jgi:GNAT superfamily N-acetyltransferase